MITLPGPWDGIPILAPFSWQRFGGWTHIPWKDFYLIYLTIATYVVFTVIWTTEYIFKKKTLLLPILSFLVLSWAIQHTYHSRFINTREWNKNQKDLVGATLYDFATRTEKIVFKLWYVKTIF